MSNVDTRTKAFFDRMLRLETEKRDVAESLRDLAKEMKGVGLGVDEIAGIKLAVRRSFESEEKRTKRESAESVADALGDFKDSPLGAAAVERASVSPKVQRAAMKFVDRIKRGDHDVTIHMSGQDPIHIKSGVGGVANEPSDAVGG
jgi:uncharacterized protein (UPF0335 family)